jgi:hypothetical protein
MLYYRTTNQLKESKGQARHQTAPQKGYIGIMGVMWYNSQGQGQGADNIRKTKAKQKREKDQEPRT